MSSRWVEDVESRPICLLFAVKLTWRHGHWGQANLPEAVLGRVRYSHLPSRALVRKLWVWYGMIVAGDPNTETASIFLRNKSSITHATTCNNYQSCNPSKVWVTGVYFCGACCFILFLKISPYLHSSGFNDQHASTGVSPPSKRPKPQKQRISSWSTIARCCLAASQPAQPITLLDPPTSLGWLGPSARDQQSHSSPSVQEHHA